MVDTSLFLTWCAVFALVEYLVRARLGLPFSWREIHRVAFAAAEAGQQESQSFRDPQAEAMAATLMRCYQVLQLPPNASKRDIGRNYRQLAKKYHPDVNSSPAAEEKFKELARAYEMLKKLGRG